MEVKCILLISVAAIAPAAKVQRLMTNIIQIHYVPLGNSTMSCLHTIFTYWH